MAGGIPLLQLLTLGARAAYSFFVGLAETSASATSIINQARAAGFSFRTQQGYDIIAALRNNQSTAQYLRSVPNDTTLNPDKFGTALTKMLRNYSYRVKVSGINPDTGETINQNIVVSSNQVLSKDQILGIATTMVTDPNTKYYVDIDSIDVVDALKAEGI